MIASIGMHECNSFDEEDIDELEEDLNHLDGPSLDYFQNMQEDEPITAITSQDIIMSMLDQQGRNVKFVGKGLCASYRAFFYVLLLIGAEQRKNYPHLNTLIRQQFYKPNIFCDSDECRANMASAGEMLQKSLKYFEWIGEGIKLEDYIIQQPVFLDAGVIMLKNSIQLQDSRSVFDQLVSKFNIDASKIKHQNESECLLLGANKRYYIIREMDYYFVMITQVKQDQGQSKFDLESVRSGESGLLVIPQNSEQSTPKFKNSQVKFRKKSHKNSFGGDFQIVQYRDLLHFQSQKLIKPKVLSEYYDADGIQSCAENLIDSTPKAHTFQDIIDSPSVDVKIKSEMKGSTTLEPTHQSNYERRKDRKISSSEIIEFKDFSRLARHDSLPQPSVQEKEEDSPSKPYNSLVVAKEQTPQPIRMRTSLIQHRELERIEERQSSQKESTHVDLSSQPSDVQAETNLLQNESQVKLKDRKYSYFTQQMASSKYRNQKKIETGNYVFNIPKNIHKNSEVIMPNQPEHEFIKRRFQENPLRFSQLGSPSEESGFDSALLTQQREMREKNLKISSSVYTYQIRFQPQNWLKKQIIYYLPNQQKEVYSFERSYPIPYIPAPAQNIVNYRQSTISDHHFVQTGNLPVQIRQSFGSSKSLLSQMQNQQPQPYISQCNTSQTHTAQSYYNPYQINETSFLKNRIQSLTNLELYNQTEQSDDSKSVIFPSSRSMKEINVGKERSPVKINFNYISSKSTITSTPVANPEPPQWQPLNRPLQQQRYIQEPRFINNQSLNREIYRPQTFNGFGSPSMRRVLRQPMR